MISSPLEFRDEYPKFFQSLVILSPNLLKMTVEGFKHLFEMIQLFLFTPRQFFLLTKIEEITSTQFATSLKDHKFMIESEEIVTMEEYEIYLRETQEKLCIKVCEKVKTVTTSVVSREVIRNVVDEKLNKHAILDKDAQLRIKGKRRLNGIKAQRYFSFL